LFFTKKLVINFKLSHEKAKEGFLASFQCIGSSPRRSISSQDSSKKNKRKQKKKQERIKWHVMYGIWSGQKSLIGFNFILFLGDFFELCARNVKNPIMLLAKEEEQRTSKLAMLSMST
jgi:hypothetical protein